MADLMIDKAEAQHVRSTLLDTAVAPSVYSHFINVGTDPILDVLEEEYFKIRLPEGAGCFKFLQGYYGSGKTQFIYSLAARAWRNDIATAVVNIGIDCPFNSPLAIYRSIMQSMVPALAPGDESGESKGIELLLNRWIERKFREAGVSEGEFVDPEIKENLEKLVSQTPMGYPDTQMMLALQRLTRSILNHLAKPGVPIDVQALQWVRGENVRFPELQKTGISERVNDSNAFNRLKTLVLYLRKVMGHRGFLIAFDEGTRTGSFRRASQAERQAIENMLTMINETSSRGFGGVMFLYAATPDFRAEVVQRYQALDARIGGAAFSQGSPMVPLIDLDSVNSDELVAQIGERLRQVFSRATGTIWDEKLQEKNMEMILEAEKTIGFSTTINPRQFVYHYCIFLKEQEQGQSAIADTDATKLVANEPPEVV